jgi:hypothetical protein
MPMIMIMNDNYPKQSASLTALTIAYQLQITLSLQVKQGLREIFYDKQDSNTILINIRRQKRRQNEAINLSPRCYLPPLTARRRYVSEKSFS